MLKLLPTAERRRVFSAITTTTKRWKHVYHPQRLIVVAGRVRQLPSLGLAEHRRGRYYGAMHQCCFHLSHTKCHGHSHGGHGHSHGGSLHDDDEDLMDTHQPLVDKSVDPRDAMAADRVTWMGVFLNIALSGMKGVAGLAFHSSSLLADAVHSASDLVSDAVTLASLKYCARPADASHPFGYGKYETMGALSVSILLLGGSAGIFHHSFESLLEVMRSDAASTALQMHPAAFGIATLSVVSKEALYRWTIAIGNRINSSVLIANAWHHRSDAITSLVAMGGVGLSLLGLPMCDPLGGMLVGGVIFKMGGEIGLKATRDLCDASLAPKTYARIRKAVDDVVLANHDHSPKQEPHIRIHKLRGRRLGRSLQVELELQVDSAAQLTLDQACVVKQQIKQTIQQRVPRAQDVVIQFLATTTATTTTTTATTTGSHHHHDNHHGAHHAH